MAGEWVLPAFLPPSDALHDDLPCGGRAVRRAQVSVTPGFRPVEVDLEVPASAGSVPVVLWIHGGAWRIGTNRDTVGPVPSRALREGLLATGIAVASTQYRLTAEATFPAQLHDVVAAVRWLRRFAPELGLDPGRIGVIGESAGGHLAAFLAMDVQDPALLGSGGVGEGPAGVQAAVAWYAPTDLVELGRDALVPGVPMDHDAADSPESLLLGGPVQEVVDAARTASPLAYVSGRAAPILLLHGDRDAVVSPRQSERFERALRAAGAEVELEIAPGAGHVFAGVDPQPLVDRSVAFLRGRLGAAE